MRRGDLFVLSWESLRRVEWGKVSSFLSMSTKSVPASTRLEDPSRKGTMRTAKSAPFNPCPSREGPYSTLLGLFLPSSVSVCKSVNCCVPVVWGHNCSTCTVILGHNIGMFTLVGYCVPVEWSHRCSTCTVILGHNISICTLFSCCVPVE